MAGLSPLVAPDPGWPAAFRAEADRISGAVVLAVQHVGSTSVPGLTAKPIIDMLGEVADLAQADAMVPGLAGLGYEAMGEFGIPGRRYFRHSEGGQRRHHLHVFQTGATRAWAMLAFRDYLRGHPREAQAYAKAKQAAAAGRETYQTAKADFVEALEARACDWAAKRQILASYNDPTGQLCVDIRRDLSGFTWVACRRDPEDSHGWRLTGPRGDGFDSAAAARTAAAREYPWVQP